MQKKLFRLILPILFLFAVTIPAHADIATTPSIEDDKTGVTVVIILILSCICLVTLGIIGAVVYFVMNKDKKTKKK